MSEKQTPNVPTDAAAPGGAPAGLPGRLTAAAVLCALQGLALAGLGGYLLFDGIAGHVNSARQAETGGLTLLAIAALPLIAARGLRLGRRWSRGPALITQLTSLPVAWTLWTAGGALTAAAVALAAVALAVVALLVNPTATEALGIGPAA
ncbi:hypothetical protein [Streptomyces sp. A1136]|uniref:hypothetical protein n=1 Tax=Streptomyces sp. A1136 TaxID=2563102 RepID=UPI00109E5E1B|nr:hypothetical protein [Streptomyces sp. A1136]THA52416.1 hypothetical protein E6R62_20970 [Streptomyces sp. A1136]